MRPEARRRLDRLVWKERARIVLVIALGLVVLGALYAYAYWPDPVVEVRIVSGVVTDWMKNERKHRETSTVTMSVSLDDGRDVVVTQSLPNVLWRGPAEIEERRHKSGQLSYKWVKSKFD